MSLQKSLFHSTNKVFSDFDTSIGIGIHFGTKKSSLQRLKSLSLPDFEVEHSYPTEKDLNCKFFYDNFINQVSISDEIDEIDLFFNPNIKLTDIDFKKEKIINSAFLQIFPKTSLDPYKLRQKISELPIDEINLAIKEYSSSPYHYAFNKSIELAEIGDVYLIKIDGEKFSSRSSEVEARRLISDLKGQMIKEVILHIDNPLRLPDLGVWTPELISESIPLNESEKKSIISISDNCEKFSFLKSVIFSRGYDSIIYKNEVEDSGSDSYIALRDDQIEIVSPKIKETYSYSI